MYKDNLPAERWNLHVIDLVFEFQTHKFINIVQNLDL